MVNLLYFPIKKKYSILNDLVNCAKGDVGIVIAAHKFYDLSNLINCANYSILQSDKEERDANFKLYFLRNAILDYNACYDYFLQILYFAFNFFTPFDNKEEYKRRLKEECKISQQSKIAIITDKYEDIKGKSFAKAIKGLMLTNNSHKSFIKEFFERCEFVNNKDCGIREWANNIKHQGGFCLVENTHENGYVDCVDDEGKLLFSTKFLIPFDVKYSDVLERLEKQNNHIVDTANWLFCYIFEDTSEIDFSKKRETIIEGTEIYKIRNCYVTNK